MKKVFLIIGLTLSFLIVTGCTLTNNDSPKEKVKEFLDKYKNQDSDVISDLDEIISSEYTGDYKERYKTLMINQYKNLSYKITDEVVDGNTALVSVDITVYNYSKAIDEANNYLSEHEKEFYKKSTDEEKNNTDLDNEKFLDYKLDLLETVSDKVTNTIEFSLTKENDNWKLDSLSDTDIEKIHGLYTE